MLAQGEAAVAVSGALFPRLSARCPMWLSGASESTQMGPAFFRFCRPASRSADYLSQLKRSQSRKIMRGRLERAAARRGEMSQRNPAPSYD